MEGIVRKIFSLLFAVCFTYVAFAQNEVAERPVDRISTQNSPLITAKFIPDSIAIGDHFKLEVTIEKDIMQGIAFPDFEDGMFNEVVEILAESGVDTVSVDGRDITLKKEYLLTTFEDGYIGMGHFPMLYVDKNITDTIFSRDSLFLTVGTFAIDTTTMDIYDIKAPLNVSYHPKEFIGYIIALLVLALLIYVLVKYVQYCRKKKGLKGDSRPSEKPHVVAIQALEEVHNQKLWQNHKHKLYYTRITDILREYIEERYGIQAMEMTSEEIIVALNDVKIPVKNYQDLVRLLKKSDLVKFAKYIPEASYNEEAYDHAYYFVEETKPNEVIETTIDDLSEVIKEEGK